MKRSWQGLALREQRGGCKKVPSSCKLREAGMDFAVRVGGAAWVAALGWFIRAERGPPPPQGFRT